MNKYAEWIDAYRARVGATKGKCHSAVQEIKAAFPELRIERGFIRYPEDWDNETKNDYRWIDWETITMHWWCITPEGEIVDPTADQFTCDVRYEPYDWQTHGQLPTGKCMGCSKPIFNNQHFCGTKCEKAFMEDLSGR